jgi:hypothetical protein
MDIDRSPECIYPCGMTHPSAHHSVWTHLVQPCISPLPSQAGDAPLSVRFELWFGDELRAEGSVDWQCGVTLYQATVAPDQWSAMAASALRAIQEAKALLGANWVTGGQADPA